MPAVDFLHPRRASPWGLACLGLGLAATVAAGVCHLRWTAAREQAQRQAQNQARLREQSRQAAMQVSRPPALSTEERRWAAVVPQLRQPWLPTLRVIEAATQPPVYLRTLSIDPAQGAIRLEAEAPSFAQALAYVQSLQEPGAVGGARLTSHEPAAAAGAAGAVRFSVLAQWPLPFARQEVDR